MKIRQPESYFNTLYICNNELLYLKCHLIRTFKNLLTRSEKKNSKQFVFAEEKKILTFPFNFGKALTSSVASCLSLWETMGQIPPNGNNLSTIYYGDKKYIYSSRSHTSAISIVLLYTLPLPCCIDTLKLF